MERAKISIATDIVFIYDNMYVLLIERKNDPYNGSWALPGGFVEENETIQEAAFRELREETNASIFKLHDFKNPYIWDRVTRDPRGRVISVSYVLRRDKDINANSKNGLNNINVLESSFKAGDDASRLRFFNLQDIWDNRISLAFDHKQIIENYALFKG